MQSVKGQTLHIYYILSDIWQLAHWLTFPYTVVFSKYQVCHLSRHSKIFLWSERSYPTCCCHHQPCLRLSSSWSEDLLKKTENSQRVRDLPRIPFQIPFLIRLVITIFNTKQYPLCKFDFSDINGFVVGLMNCFSPGKLQRNLQKKNINQNHKSLK